jgi:hypothetical protein
MMIDIAKPALIGISRRRLLEAGSAAALATAVKAHAATASGWFPLAGSNVLQSQSIRPSWLVPEAGLPVIPMNVAASVANGAITYDTTNTNSYTSGWIVDCPSGNWGFNSGQPVSCGIGIQTNQIGSNLQDGALIVFRCSDGGQAIFAPTSCGINLNDTSIRVGIKYDHISFYGDLVNTNTAFESIYNAYIGLFNFEVFQTSIAGNGVEVTTGATGPIPNHLNLPIVELVNGNIHHCGGDGAHHNVYLSQVGDVRIENVHSWGARCIAPFTGGHLLKVYSLSNAQIFNCLLEQVVPPDLDYGYPGFHTTMQMIDIGTFAQTTIAGCTFNRNSNASNTNGDEDPSPYHTIYHNRADDTFGNGIPLPNLSLIPYWHLFALNTINNTSVMFNTVGIDNEGTIAQGNTGSLGDWSVSPTLYGNKVITFTYNDWTQNDCVLYTYGNTYKGNPFTQGEAISVLEIVNNGGTGTPGQLAPCITLSSLPAWAHQRLYGS